jgi:hypothetical protein
MTRTMNHAAHSTFLLSCIGAVMLAGCAPGQSANDTNAQKRRSSSDSQSLRVPPYLGAVTAQPNTLATGKQSGPRRPPVEPTVNARATGTIPTNARRGDTSRIESLTVASFLDRAIDAGQRVEVTGTCIDQFHAGAGAGAPPVSRSDWQLASGTRVVYVVGRMPTSCATEAATTISATVGVDTTIIAGKARPRRYLVIPRQ